MTKISDLYTKYKKYFWIGLGVLVLVLLLSGVFSKNASKTGNEYIVAKANIEQSVELSGKVETSDRADLGFASSGRVERIYVKNNEKVATGRVLAQLEIGDLLADLKIKQANSQTSDIDLQAAKDELSKVTKQQDTKVANAFRTMLSEGLELEPSSSSYDVEPPTLGGLYDGVPGQYKIRIKRENATSNDFEVLTFNLENSVRQIDEEGKTPLGTKGLYISFGGVDLDSYDDTVWFLDIPNKASASYLPNLNAYNEAKNTRDLAIKDAQSAYDKLLAEDGGGSSVAQAEIQKINAEIRKNTIYAPFSGIVTNIEKEVGENASTGETIISILGEEKLEVVLQVSELDVSKLIPGMSIKVTLDAFPGEDFYGTLKTVNSKETTIDGVPVYEAFVELSSSERIKTGMSASGSVVLDKRENVLVIPSYFVKKVDGKDFVEIADEKGKTTDKEVTLGLVGSDNMVEVLSGLTEGEKIVSTSAKK